MGERFMKQVKNVCDMVVMVYDPTAHTCIFIFEQSSCHWKFSSYALQAKTILVKDGGEQRVRDTTWAGRPQAMVHPDGRAKG